MDAVTRFAEAAADFCAWCEGEPGAPRDEARTALRHVSRLLLLALDLRELDDVPEVASDRPDDDEWRAVNARCAALPFQYYASVFDPRITPDKNLPETLTGDLADDLADIHRDLSDGLSLWRTGHPDAAEWQWAWSFRNHWGRHATDALRALHCWFADEAAW